MELKDAVFEIMALCKNDNAENKINGTIGSLKDENNNIVTYDAYYNTLRTLSDAQFATYAQKPKGNDEYTKAITDYVLENHISKPTETIGTCGGTGAIAAAMHIFCKTTKKLIMPNVCWPNIASIAKSLDLSTVLFDIEDLDDLFNKIDQTEEKEFILYINDPAENPTGITLGLDKWQSIINKLNSLDKTVYLVNDIAYIDYCYSDDKKDYMQALNSAKDNVILAICFSASKGFSTYGIRLGALILSNDNQETVDKYSLDAQFYIRTTVSNINASAMIAAAKLINEHKAEYLKERENNKALLKQRASLFQEEVDKNDLPVYPYHDGFFYTLKFTSNEERDVAFAKMLEDHMYFVKTNLGIRIAICSIPLCNLKNLGERIKKCL